MLTLSPVVINKAVPPAVPINVLNQVVISSCSTIDLTNDDVIEVSNGYSLENSPIKIIQTSTGSSPKPLVIIIIINNNVF